MIRKILGYLPSTVIPAVMSFMMLYVYTRLMDPAEYGQFSLVFTTTLFVLFSIFISVSVAVMRFLKEAEYAGRKAEFIAACMLFLAVPSALVALVALGLIFQGNAMGGLFCLGAALTIIRSVVSLTQTVRRAEDRIALFNWVECGQSVLSLALGALFMEIWGANATAAVSGLLLAAIISAVPSLRLLFEAGMHVGRVNRAELRKLLSFVAPLVVVDVTVSVLQLSDRFLLGALASASALGVYSVAFNLVDRPTQLLCNAITTATFPMAVDAMHRGTLEGRSQMAKNGAALIALTLPACIGLWLTKGIVVQILVGPEFRAGAEVLVPIMCMSALVRGISTHFVDHAFQLASRPSMVLRVYLPAAIATVVLNILLIPILGAKGAALAGLVCQVAALIGGWIAAKRVFPIYLNPTDLAKIGIALVPMVAWLTSTDFSESWQGLGAAVGSGAFLFVSGVVLLNVGGVRGRSGGFAVALLRRRGRTA